jgi:hypothetical protein
MKTLRTLTIISAIGLMGLWGCSSKNYTTTSGEYDDLYGNSSDGIVAVAGRGEEAEDEDLAASRNRNPEYQNDSKNNNPTSSEDYYDESYLSSRGLSRNYSPTGGYNNGFADGYRAAQNSLTNWHLYDPWGRTYNNWSPGFSFGMSYGMMGRYGNRYAMNPYSVYGYDPYSPFGYNPYSPFGNNSYAYNSGWGWNDPWNSWGNPYNSYYGGYNNYGYNNGSSIWYSNPRYVTNQRTLTDPDTKRTYDYNRVSRGSNTYNDRFDNDAKYSSRRTSSEGVGSSTGTAAGNYSSSRRGNASEVYYGSNGSSAGRTSTEGRSAASTTDSYSGRSRGNSSSSYSTDNSSRQRSSYSTPSSSNSSDYGSRSSSSYSSPSYSSPSSSSSSSSSGSSSSSSGGGSTSRGPR